MVHQIALHGSAERGEVAGSARIATAWRPGSVIGPTDL